MKLIKYFKRKFKKKMKIEIGKEYKVIKTPKGKQSSGCMGTQQNSCQEVIVKINNQLPTSSGYTCDAYSCTVVKLGGQPYYATNYTVYSHELTPNVINLETLNEEIEEAKKEIAKLTEKIKDCEDKKKFLTEQKIEEFSDEDFKAYQVLKVMGIDDIEKAKQITKILGR